MFYKVAAADDLNRPEQAKAKVVGLLHLPY